MDVAVVGAAGDIGRTISALLIEQRVVPPDARLQLVGHRGGPGEPLVHGLTSDLYDAFDERTPLLEPVFAPEGIRADVIVFAAGRTPPAVLGGSTDRDALARDNAEVFRAYARAIAASGNGQEVVIVVSNPVELGVAIFAAELGRERVIGMGAWLDTLRFRRAIAAALGLHRQRVGGFAAGQHGDAIVPLWSTVRLHGLTPAEERDAIAGLRGGRTLETHAAEVTEGKRRKAEIAATDFGDAYRFADALAPDVRFVAAPWLTHQSGAKTRHGTAGAVVDLVATVLDGREILVAGQVALDGEIQLLGEPVQRRSRRADHRRLGGLEPARAARAPRSRRGAAARGRRRADPRLARRVGRRGAALTASSGRDAPRRPATMERHATRHDPTDACRDRSVRDPQLLHHRAHRPRQVDARRPHAPDHRRRL